MRRRNKVIVGAVLAAVLLFGSLGGVALATGPEEGGLGDFIDKVTANYESETGDTLNREALEVAIINAKTQMREAAMEKRLQGLTDEQKEVLQDWWDSRPEDLPMKFGSRMHGGFLRGMCRLPGPAE